MTTFTSWKEDDGRRVRWVHDELYETKGSYAYETEEETRRAEEWELERLAGGSLVALGCIIESPCCECGQWVVEDSLWGIVIEPDEEKLREFRQECM